MLKDLINFYRVEDLNKTRDFYERVLGLEVFKDQGKCIIYKVNEHGKLGFCSHFPSDKNENACITFVYDSKKDVDEIYEKLKRQDIIVDKVSENEYFKIYHFFSLDPDNHKIEFQVFLED